RACPAFMQQYPSPHRRGMPRPYDLTHEIKFGHWRYPRNATTSPAITSHVVAGHARPACGNIRHHTGAACHAPTI
ncbi:hypothetical protein ACQKFN_01075, partial [Serratia sp. NPDC071084]|uniref:hypothetical protein n=1 Tax=Serratia sp. NPDC071084 TaxID=3390676 RepID=UPI003D08A602